MMEKKKNNNRFIIPASYFQKKGITPIPVNKPSKVEETVNATIPKEEIIEKTPVSGKAEVIEKFQVKEPPKIELKQDTKRTSGLSLKSIKAKKEHQIRQMDVVIDEKELPKEDFTEKELVKCWKAFTAKIEKDGKHNLASILAIDTPKVKGTTVHLEFPNETNKVELERQQYELMGFLRKSLNNFDINLSITINEEVSKKYAYTTREKFEKLKEKNAAIEALRKTFDLDI